MRRTCQPLSFSTAASLSCACQPSRLPDSQVAMPVARAAVVARSAPPNASTIMNAREAMNDSISRGNGLCNGLLVLGHVGRDVGKERRAQIALACVGQHGKKSSAFRRALADL